MAIQPELGTLDDFDRLVEAAARHGLEIALDIAFQCSPDHPYVREHPEWFRHRPDGTIKYAENPPKKYQDIYPIDFESSDWQALWEELQRRLPVLDRATACDLPRRQPAHQAVPVLGLGASARSAPRHPDTIFLAEAFTRPKVMRHLAKGGFSQSYSYFTWRNTKAELTEYFTELTQTEVAEFMRPNLFANTPDILHEYLQTAAARRSRSGSCSPPRWARRYGIYGGFELCRERPVKAGQRGIPRLGEVPGPPARLRSAGQPRRAHPHDQHAPPGSPGAAARSRAAVPPDRQPRAALLQQTFGRRHRSHSRRRQRRSLPHAARLRAAADRRVGLHAERHDRGRGSAVVRAGTTGAAPPITSGSSPGHASRTCSTCDCLVHCLRLRPCRTRPEPS